MIHRAGIATDVPPGGSVRSGAVELFLAGAQRRAAPSAEFAVHSWRDADGLEARDFPASDPVNRAYLDYYREMGLSDGAGAGVLCDDQRGRRTTMRAGSTRANSRMSLD